MPLDYPIHERVLDNGLRVVVSPDTTVPNVTVNLWVGVGSRHEVPGRTGFAHLFEHLMFQGSRQVASGEHFSALMTQGGRLNATTWFDRTNYFETVPKGAYELALWMEADRHGFLLDAVNQENLDNQRDVVKEEKRQRYDNVPYGTALIEVYAAVFPQGHPYHHPTIGSMADLDAASVEDVHAFFERHYCPANTVLTLVGDLTPEEGFAAAERYFGGLAAQSAPETVEADPLPPLQSPVHVVVTDSVPNDRLHIAFRLPRDTTEEYFAGALAIDILAGLTTARLHQRLVRRERLANAVQGHSMGLVGGVSLAFLAIDVADGVDPAAAEAAAMEELTRFADEGPSSVEMESALAQSERSWLSALASQEDRADLISQHALLYDDAGFVNTFLDRLALVDADRVRLAADRWLRPTSRAVVSFIRSTSEEAA